MKPKLSIKCQLWLRLFVLLNSHFILLSVGAFDPITIGTIGTIGAASGIGYFYKNTLECYYECCHGKDSDKWIRYEPDFSDFEKHIFGQHIAIKAVTSSIKQHLRNDSPPKALVLSFHGYTGVGKNHLAGLISRSIYHSFNDTGISKYVHKLSSTHFIDENNQRNALKLVNLVKENIKNCERSLFIIDEVDKFPEKFLDYLTPFIKSSASIDGVNYNKAIFLFLGNSGGKLINTKTNELRSKGISRKNIRYQDFDSILNDEAFHSGGLKNTKLLKHGLVDLFVPFLPLEKEHVKLCVISYLKYHRNFDQPTIVPGNHFIKMIVNEMEYISDVDIYSRFGCRRVAARIDILL